MTPARQIPGIILRTTSTYVYFWIGTILGLGLRWIYYLIRVWLEGMK
jgi:hypothetical protein